MAPKLFAMFAHSQIMLQSMKRANIAKFGVNSMKPLSSQSESVEQVNSIKPLSSQSKSEERDESRLGSLKRSEPIISGTTIYREPGRGMTGFSGGTFAELYSSAQLTKLVKELFLNQKDDVNQKDERHQDDKNIFDHYVEPTEITYKSIDGERKIVSWEGGKVSELKNYITQLRDVCADDEIIDDDKADDGDEKDIDDTDGKESNFEYSQSAIDEDFAKYTAEKDLKK